MRIGRWLAVAAVLVAYAFYGSHGTFRWALGPWGQSYYANLAEGFLGGTLSMAAGPAEELTKLADPYDFNARRDIPVLWDASYFEGRYYLYFSPVPVLLFYVPVRLLAGAYPSDDFAATFFASVSFLFFAGVVWRTKWSWLWILLVGVGNVVPYVIVGVLFYQVAVACGMAFTAAWAYSVVRFLDGKERWAIPMGIFLGMAIATRPNLAVLLLVQALLLIRHRRAILHVAIPLVVIAGALAAYNYARFRDPFEFGVTYQMARVPMKGRAICGVCGPGEVPRLMNHASHYVFWPILFHGKFPWVWVQNNRLDPEVTYPGSPEPIAGIAPVTPLALAGTGFALLLARERRGRWLVLAGWLVLLALSSCWWVTARYTLDFLGLVLSGAILCIDDALAFFSESRALRWACALLALYSIVLGLLLPWSLGARFM
ncbi:MAG TPA: hypothetical protein VEO54_06685 [Thermoanaerobaculia bacterium]|nr:hypothetical protein [Thermoanaerobaculia bacterium]